MNLYGMLEEKLTRLRAEIKSYQSCLIAYSGGVDSVFLAFMAHQVLGEKSLAVIADSPSLARDELKDALDLAEKFQFQVRVIKTDEFSNPDYISNASNRCYFCKSALFSQLEPLAKNEGFQVIAYGENLDDVGDIRPGAQAASEYRIQSPLKKCEFSKDEIRKASSQFGLPTAEKPQMACLSSRIPHGDAVSVEKLARVERAERLLNSLGFAGARVRSHDLKLGCLARVELEPAQIQTFTDKVDLADFESQLKNMGFIFVTIDLGGYKPGGRSTSQTPLASESVQNHT